MKWLRCDKPEFRRLIEIDRIGAAYFIRKIHAFEANPLASDAALSHTKTSAMGALRAMV